MTHYIHPDQTSYYEFGDEPEKPIIPEWLYWLALAGIIILILNLV
jgi:hypothetical protein